jgi:glutamyl-tRNA(Gln) amidotransferase subunit E
LFHSDELPKYGITDSEVEAIRHAVDCKPDDAFVIIADDKEKVTRALGAVLERANLALEGVPKEVRKANPDATTSFLRPMPGAARMYPETDVPAITITKEYLEGVEIPERIEDKAKRYVSKGIGQDLADLVARSDKAQFFEHLLEKYPSLKPAYIAETIMGAVKTVKRQFGVDVNPAEHDFEALFDAISKEEVPKENVLEILKQNKPVESIIDDYKMMSDDELEQEIQHIVGRNKDMPFNALIGKVMGELRGKASGKKISEILKKLTS